MKPKVVPAKLPDCVVKRFPHLEKELRDMVTTDEGFQQLCLDYDDLNHALMGTNAKTNDNREELLGLKTSLEVEILEQVTRSET